LILPEFGTKCFCISSKNKHTMGLTVYVINVRIELYSSLVYSNIKYHLDNADDPNVLQPNLTIYFDSDD